MEESRETRREEGRYLRRTGICIAKDGSLSGRKIDRCVS